MEQIYQRRVENRRTNQYKEVKQVLLSCSNAIHVGGYSFAELPPDFKSVLGIKKSLS